ncbi:MAG TPA: PIG-L family deacetylase [Acidobacteriaceae bacterium]|jgi:LmbE family N-acetylglucosaminyl deacetylase|nr:PIG-L family deacetylase [Acidobacteriaceae bacterium]
MTPRSLLPWHRTRGSIAPTFLCAILLCITPIAVAAQVVPWRTQIAASPDAQTLPQDRGADGLAQTLRKLNTWGSLLFIVAHPDDEDGGMLAYESRGMGARTAILTLTRGEGGQNAMSSESYDALGLIRTNELLLADRYSGSEQYFTRVVDYGFSKTIDEAHQQWGRERVLCDVVRVVRMDRPLVTASTFTGNITDGHGHHQVSGEMNQEAFSAAGDPKVCPDQIAAGLRPWSPLKVYARQPFFAPSSKGLFDYATNKWSPVRFYDYVTQKWNDTYPSMTLEVPEGTWDPVLGESYFQMARTGWSEQKSQNGGGTLPFPGPVSVAYHRYGSRVSAPEQEGSFFDGIDTSLPGMAALVHSGDTLFLVAGLKAIQGHVTAALSGDSPAHPERIAPELAEGYKATQQLIEQVNGSGLSADDKANLVHELNIKLAQFNTALAEALGLHVNAVVMPRTATGANAAPPIVPEETPTDVTPGSEIDVRLHVTAGGDWGPSTEGLQLARTWLANQDGDSWQMTRLGAPGLDEPQSSAGDVIFRVYVPRSAHLTRPYFTRPNTEQAYYDITDPRWLSLPFAPYPLAGWAEFHYMGVPIRVGEAVQTMHRVHGIGGVYQPLAVVPQISVNLPAEAGVVPLGTSTLPFSVSVSNQQQSDADGTLHLDLPAGWTADPAAENFHLPPGSRQDLSFTLHSGQLTGQDYEIRAVAQSGNARFSEGFTTVGYPGLRPYYLYHPAAYRLRAVDVKVPHDLKVGYIMGTGDEVPGALSEIGIQPHLLSSTDLTEGDLSSYDAIIVGIRAYSSRPDLSAATSRLLNYVRNGGTMLVQYQSVQFPAPYDLSLGRNPEKVVDERTPVAVTDPANPLLNWPNRITSADFDGWVEERGHSFLGSWSSQYTALTETQDPGQAPQRGGLLYTRYGKGNWMYLAYAVYRQLPEAVPGAYRLLADLVAAGKNPGLH